MSQPQHIVFVLVGEFSHLAFSNALEPLRIANRESGEALYRWSLMAEGGAVATSSSGIRMMVDHDLDALPRCDAVFLVTGNDMRAHISRPLLALLRRARAAGVTLGTFCSGAYVFAKAGFLDGRRCALHWEFHDAFREEFPDVKLETCVFVEDGPFVTASGGQAAGDLMIARIRADHGEALAMRVSEQMVCGAIRPSATEQRISFQARTGLRNRKVAQAVRFMSERLEESFSSQEIADELGVSVRQLERLFNAYLHMSPKRYLMQLRIDRARQLLTQTEMPMIDISTACGFSSPTQFARAWRGIFGTKPAQFRKQAG